MRTAAAPLLVALSLAIAAPARSQEADPPNYLPLKAGNKWTYEVPTPQGQKVQVTQEVAEIETINGEKMARLEVSANGQVAASEHDSVTPEGILRHRLNGIACSPPILIFKLPNKDGETWKQTTKVGAETLDVEFTAGAEEEVTVPAGKFKAIPIRAITTTRGMKIDATSWYAPEVGVVRVKMDIGGGGFTQDLIKFEPAK